MLEIHLTVRYELSGHGGELSGTLTADVPEGQGSTAGQFWLGETPQDDGENTLQERWLVLKP